MDEVKIIGLDNREFVLPLSYAGLVAHLRQERLAGRQSVVVEIGAWRILVTLLGDTEEPLLKQLLEVRQ